jgi:hypothetical protein
MHMKGTLLVGYLLAPDEIPLMNPESHNVRPLMPMTLLHGHGTGGPENSAGTYVQHHLSLAKPFLFSLAAGVWSSTSAVA